MFELIKKYLIFFMFLLPICLYFIILVNMSENVPYLDDYHSILSFIIAYLKTGTAAEKIQLIFAQHNDHRIAFQRSVVLVQYYLCDSINFKYLIIFGNLSIVGILIILMKSCNKTYERFFQMLPVVYLLFSFRYFEASFWAMVTLTGLWVVTFSLASILLLSRDGVINFIGSCFFATLAMYTQGNGKLVLASGFVLLLLKKKYRGLCYWLIFSGALCLSTLLFKFTYGGYQNVLTVLQAPLNHIVSVFSFLGLFAINLKLSIILGGIIIIGFLHCCRKRYYQQNLALFVMFFHIILTAVAVGYARPSIYFSSRYSIYSVLALVIMYLIYSDIYSYLTSTKYFVTITGIFIACSLICNFTFAPLYIKLYTSRIRHYEKNVVLGFQGNIIRDKANRICIRETSGILDSIKPGFIPDQVNYYLRPLYDTHIEYIMTPEHWWLKWIPSFSNGLIMANSMKIYSINNMFDTNNDALF